MAKSLKALANQLKRNHGFTWIPTFDGALKPGSVVELKRWNDINHIGNLTDDREISARDLEPILGPEPCMLADFNRFHELRVDAALSLLQPAKRAKAAFQRAREAVAKFDTPVTYRTSLIQLDALVDDRPQILERALGKRLKLKRTWVVYQVVRGRISFLFRGSGGPGIDLRAAPELARLSEVELSTNWRWRNEATLESKREIVIAAELARYHRKRGRFITR